MSATPSTQKLSLFALTAMVVGSMVGPGTFSLPRTFGIATGPFGAMGECRCWHGSGFGSRRRPPRFR